MEERNLEFRNAGPSSYTAPPADPEEIEGYVAGGKEECVCFGMREDKTGSHVTFREEGFRNRGKERPRKSFSRPGRK